MHSKIYILIRKNIKDKDLGHAALNIAHAMAVGFKRWHNDLDFQEWLNNSFRKVLCEVTDEEFERAKTILPEEDYAIIGECALNDDVSIIFKPRKEWPKFFKYLKLFK
jgi:hypothetical protein